MFAYKVDVRIIDLFEPHSVRPPFLFPEAFVFMLLPEVENLQSDAHILHHRPDLMIRYRPEEVSNSKALSTSSHIYEMTDLRHQLELIRWVKQEEGYIHPSVEVASDPGDRGFHIRVGAGQTIRPNTRIASCPISTTLSALNTVNIAPFRSHGTNFPPSFIDTQSSAVVQYFFLMEQFLLGQDSFWAPYVSAIPQPDDIDSMLFAEGGEDRRWLAGTNLHGALARQNDEWKELYKGAIVQLKELQWPNTERYTWRLFLWAAMIFVSRGFTSQVLSDTLPADQARPAGHDHPRHQELSKLFSDGFPVLCPLLDVLNYKLGVQVEWQPRSSYVGLQVLEQYEAGEEICNNYGPRDNEKLILGYGFAIASNPFDHFSVGLRVPPGSALVQTRAWSLEKKRQEDFQCFIFNIEHPRAESATCLEASVFSYDLLDSVSVLCANNRELQVMLGSQKTYISSKLGSKTTCDNRNLLHTLTQLYRECRQRLSLLQESDPQLHGKVARTPQQRYAQIYRESQMEILATAMLLCKFTLLRARTDSSKDEVLERVRAGSQLKQTAAFNLHKLVQHGHTSLTQPHELFGYAELSKLLHVGISESLHPVHEKPEPDTPETQRARLAVLMVVLRNTTLPPRYQTWLDRLDEWYDSSWSTLGAEHGEESESVRSLLAQYGKSARQASLSRISSTDLDRLIWAWNVIGEESVPIPKGLLTRHDRNADGDREDEESLLLYIPR